MPAGSALPVRFASAEHFTHVPKTVTSRTPEAGRFTQGGVQRPQLLVVHVRDRAARLAHQMMMRHLLLYLEQAPAGARSGSRTRPQVDRS